MDSRDLGNLFAAHEKISVTMVRSYDDVMTIRAEIAGEAVFLANPMMDGSGDGDPEIDAIAAANVKSTIDAMFATLAARMP